MFDPDCYAGAGAGCLIAAVPHIVFIISGVQLAQITFIQQASSCWARIYSEICKYCSIIITQSSAF